MAFERISLEIHRARRSQARFALMFIDLDRFKQVNDTHGHQAGDVVLRESAQRLKSVVRQYDAVGRYGGEEFLVILPGCDPAGAWSQAERIREVIQAEDFVFDGNRIRMTCSVGLACTEQSSGSQAESLVSRADQALYRAKYSGRNRVEAAPQMAVAGV